MFAGEVIIAKNEHIKTVVNKLHNIDNVYRNFSMEVVAGDPSTEVTVSENGHLFKFDFSRVFWNTRLNGERALCLKLFSRDDVICDMFAGVGPLAIPAAHKGCRVYANDLNPNSFDSLQQNARLNGVGRQLSSFCMDGRDFIQHITDNVVLCAKEVAAGRTDWANAKYPMFTQVIMNLPGLAVDFLDVFPNLLRPLERLGVTQRPMIHCYCFSKADDPLTDALQRAETSLKTSIVDEVEVVKVRDVSVSKTMVRVSFRLPPSRAWLKSDS